MNIFQYQNVNILKNILSQIGILGILIGKTILLLIGGSIQLRKCVTVAHLRTFYKFSQIVII